MSLTTSEAASASARGIRAVNAPDGRAAGSTSVVEDVRSLDQVNAALADVDARRKGRERPLPAALTLAYDDASRRLRDAFLQPPAVVAA